MKISIAHSFFAVLAIVASVATAADSVATTQLRGASEQQHHRRTFDWSCWFYIWYGWGNDQDHTRRLEGADDMDKENIQEHNAMNEVVEHHRQLSDDWFCTWFGWLVGGCVPHNARRLEGAVDMDNENIQEYNMMKEVVEHRQLSSDWFCTWFGWLVGGCVPHNARRLEGAGFENTEEHQLH